MSPQPTPTNDYGFDRYVATKDGKRLRVLMVRTIEPSQGSNETNAAFERRMHGLAMALLSMEKTLEVAYEIEKRDGHAVLCRIECYTEPSESAVIEDTKPAGGRFGAARGTRGGSQRIAA